MPGFELTRNLPGRVELKGADLCCATAPMLLCLDRHPPTHTHTGCVSLGHGAAVWFLQKASFVRCRRLSFCLPFSSCKLLQFECSQL